MKITSLLFFLIFLLSFNASGESSECKDFLAELNLKPIELQFKSCKKVEKVPAILLESYYSVSGEQAKAVENFLHKEFDLEKLRFVCCGWEGREATYVSKKGDIYAINMYSFDEFKHQEKWKDYTEFRVVVGKYLILP